MGSRLRGNDGAHPYRHPHNGGNPRPPISSFPRQREGGDGFPPARERRGAPISPSPQRRESTATHIVIPAKAGIHGGEGPGGMGPRLHGDDDGHPHRHSRDSGRAAMGSRLRGNDGAHPYRHPHNGGNPRPPISSFPRRRESTAGRGRGDGSPSPRGRRWAPTFPRRRAHPQSAAGIHGHHIVIPAKAGIHGGEGPGGMGPRLHGDDDGHPHRHSREGGNPRRGAGGDGSPSPRGRRWASTSSFPRQREGGDGFPPARERRGAPISPSPQRRESTATHIVIPTTAGIHGHHIVIPAKAGIHGGGPGGMGPRLHGDDDGHPHSPTIGGGNPRPPHRHSREGGNPWRGGAGGDGSPSPRGRRWASTSSFPRQRGAGDGFPSPRERRRGGSQVISE